MADSISFQNETTVQVLVKLLNGGEQGKKASFTNPPRAANEILKKLSKLDEDLSKDMAEKEKQYINPRKTLGALQKSAITLFIQSPSQV